MRIDNKFVGVPLVGTQNIGQSQEIEPQKRGQPQGIAPTGFDTKNNTTNKL